MPLLVLLLGLFVPRLAMVILYLGGDYLARAYQTWLWPLLGFFFMPYTTLAYAFAMNQNHSVSGGYLVILIIAVLVDVGALGSGEKARRRRRRRE